LTNRSTRRKIVPLNNTTLAANNTEKTPMGNTKTTPTPPPPPYQHKNAEKP
jgi:hypothetical protein